MANFNYDMFRIVDTLVNVQAKLLNNQFAFETTNNRIVVKDAVGAFHYFSKDDDINPTDITITDNIVDAFRVREDTNDYINVDTSDAQAIIYLGNAGTNPDVRILGSGNFSINETAPDGKFCVNIGSGSGNTITLKSDLNHGFTALDELDTFFYVKEIGSFGGVEMGAYNNGSEDGVFRIKGFHENGETDLGTIQLIGQKRSGTGAQVLDNDEWILEIKNYTTEVVAVKGNGDIITQGGIELHQDAILHSDSETDLGTGAVNWATADAAQDSVTGKSRVDVGATGGNNYYSLSDLVDGQILYIYNTGTEIAYVGAAGSGSENMVINADACGVCLYISATTNLYAAT